MVLIFKLRSNFHEVFFLGSKKSFKVKNSGSNVKISNKWTVIVTVLAFVLSVLFTLLTDGAEDLNNFVAIAVLFIIVLISIICDMLGTAVSTATEEPFHAMAAQRIKGAKETIKIIRSAQQLSSFFNDVIGDIAGIISGSMTAAIVVKIATSPTSDMLLELILTGLVSALMIGGKALGKGYALTNSNTIVFILGRIICFFSFGRKKR